MKKRDMPQFWIDGQQEIERRPDASSRTLLLDVPEPVFCAVCHSTRETVLQDRELGTGEVCCGIEDEDPPCDCIPIDVDEVDARLCPLHGPQSTLVLQAREQEAADMAAYYAGWTVEEEGFRGAADGAAE